MIREKFESVKEHVKEHKTVYVAVTASILTAGITVLVMRSNAAQRGASNDDAQRGSIKAASYIFGNRNTVSITAVVDREGRGHPGWPVRNIETGRIFMSQKEAATALGINEGILSGQLNGKFPDANGLHFERINLLGA